MALTSFDGGFSSKQQRLARVGERANETIKVSADQWARFQETPSAQNKRRCDYLSDEKTQERDQARMARDADFKPADEDWVATKACDYDKCIDYYTVLGIDELASLLEVKAAYRKLSLVYHPDKTTGMDQEQKDAYHSTFIEVKNAYKTLSHQATRRQYDRDRDRDRAAFEVSGTKIKTKPSFDAREVLKKLCSLRKAGQEDEGPEAPKLHQFDIRCKLERFYWGGYKAIRVVGSGDNPIATSKVYGACPSDELHVLDVPRGATEGRVVSRLGHGEGSFDTRIFAISSKPHPIVERRGNDLVVRQPIRLEANVLRQPCLNLHLEVLRGQHVILWGRNPFYAQGATGSGELRVRLQGSGLSPDGALHFVAAFGDTVGDAVAPVSTRGTSQVASRSSPETKAGPPAPSPAEDTTVLIHLKHLMTQGAMVVRVPKDACVADVKSKARGLLGFSSTDKLMAMEETSTGFKQYSDEMPLGSLREIGLGGKQWRAVPISKEQAARLLELILGTCEAAAFQAKLADAYAQAEAEEAVTSLWRGACDFLPDFGFEPSIPSLTDVLTRCQELLAEDPGTELLRSKCSRLAVGFCPEEFARGGSAEPESSEAATGCSGHPALAARAKRRLGTHQVCELDLAPGAGPCQLSTKPSCSLAFSSNLQQSASWREGQLRPVPMFAACLSCPAGARKAGAQDWTALKDQLVPVLHQTLPVLFQASRRLLPRPLPASQVEEKVPPATAACSAEVSDSILLRRLGDGASNGGHLFLAASYYSKCLELGEAVSEVLASRADCLLRLGQADAALSDAKQAVGADEQCFEGWRCLGEAASTLGPDYASEATDAMSRAVRLKPSRDLAEKLFAVARAANVQSSDEAHKAKLRGDTAIETRELGLAVASYTLALACIPEVLEEEVDSPGLVKAILLANRSGAFARLAQWPSAVADAEAALAAAENFAGAHGRLGVALLGCGRPEEAYAELARALKAELGSRPQLLRARDACMALLPRWSSIRAAERWRRRFGRDASRPSCRSRVFAVSDVLFDRTESQDWACKIDKMHFLEDVLLVAGNLGSTLAAVAGGLHVLRSKFRRVFYVPGNIDLMIHPHEAARFPDSIAKLYALLALCDELDVDVAPAAICEGFIVAPLLSWYSSEFDVHDPFPDAARMPDARCQWGCLDPEHQVWRYLLALNAERVARLSCQGAAVITFSHFVPRTDLPCEAGISPKAMGCAALDLQLRAARSRLHVYGHAGRSHGRSVDGVLYVQHSLYSKNRHGYEHTPLIRVFDGGTLGHEAHPIAGAC